ncbi:MAG TPA: serine/threonine-protein phosphatase [Anaerolineae bacterium]|nr:serine/threonine-protein phosphatase [Anaerolineae bacterium]
MDFLQRLFGRRKEPPAVEVAPSLEEAGVVKGASFLVGRASHVGKVRGRNEDALFTLESTILQDEESLPFGLFIVADGMGGRKGGQLASSLTTRVVADWIVREVYLPFLMGEAQDAGQWPINEALVEAVTTANVAVHEAAPEAGTTLTCALLLGANAYIAHVGDSRAYLVNRANIRRITRDHSLVDRLIELGQISPEEALTHPQRNVLYRAVGQAGTLEVDTYLQSMPGNSHLLLCSDGLWSVVPEREIVEIINNALSPQVACQRLIQAANERGGEDNITAVLVGIRG